MHSHPLSLCCGCSDIPAVVARVCIVLIVLGCYPLAFNAHRSNVILLLPLRWQAALNAPAPAEPIAEGAELPHSLGSDFSAALLLPAAGHSLQAEPTSKAAYAPLSSRARGARAGLLRRLLRDVPHAVLTAGLVTTSMIIGILVPNVEVILAYKGALGGSCEWSLPSRGGGGRGGGPGTQCTALPSPCLQGSFTSFRAACGLPSCRCTTMLDPLPWGRATMHYR